MSHLSRLLLLALSPLLTVSLGWSIPKNQSSLPAQQIFLIKPRDKRLANNIRQDHSKFRGTARLRIVSAGNLEIVAFPKTFKAKRILDFYKKRGITAYIEQDVKAEPREVPNDPLFAFDQNRRVAFEQGGGYTRDTYQWGLANIGAPSRLFLNSVYQRQEPAVAGADINALGGWSHITDASSVIVAVVDSGVRHDHPDLINNIYQNKLEQAGANGVDDDQNGYIDDIYGIAVNNGIVSTDVIDTLGHGTKVAGILGAEGNNGIGITGVAWKSQIMALKSSNYFFSELIPLIYYAVDNGARILVFSWGGGGRDNQALRDAIKYARAAGVFCIAAVPNMTTSEDLLDDMPLKFLQNDPLHEYDNLIGVTSLDRNNTLYPVAAFGEKTVHFAAPGRVVPSTTNDLTSRYVYVSGTSFATPHVAGALALLMAKSPELNFLQLRSRLLCGFQSVPALQGLVNHAARLDLGKMLALPRTTLPFRKVLERDGVFYEGRVCESGRELSYYEITAKQNAAPELVRVIKGWSSIPLGTPMCHDIRIPALTPDPSVIDETIQFWEYGYDRSTCGEG